MILALLVFIAHAAQANEQTALPDNGIGFSTITVKNGKMHFAYSGDRQKPGVIFVHGTPGGWSAFEGYLNSKRLQKDFFMISVDRLGWGGSSMTSNKVDGDFVAQAASITAVMSHFNSKKWIVVGHSLGASIAPQIAAQAPQKTSALLLLAGSLNPKLGKPRWYNLAQFKPRNHEFAK